MQLLPSKSLILSAPPSSISPASLSMAQLYFCNLQYFANGATIKGNLECIHVIGTLFAQPRVGSVDQMMIIQITLQDAKAPHPHLTLVWVEMSPSLYIAQVGRIRDRSVITWFSNQNNARRIIVCYSTGACHVVHSWEAMYVAAHTAGPMAQCPNLSLHKTQGKKRKSAHLRNAL